CGALLRSTLFPYTTLFRSAAPAAADSGPVVSPAGAGRVTTATRPSGAAVAVPARALPEVATDAAAPPPGGVTSGQSVAAAAGAGAAGLPPPAARGPSPDPPGRPPPPPGTPPDVPPPGAPPPGAPPPGAPPPPGVPPPDVPSSRVASTRTRTPSVWYTASSTALVCRALEKVRASPGAANPSFSVPFSRATTCAFGPTRDHVTRATARAPSTSCQRRRTVSVVTPGSMPSAGAASAAAGASDG